MKHNRSVRNNSHFFLIVAALIVAASSCLAAEIPAESKVSEVTLYLDRAQVTRIATVSLPVGEHTIRLRGIPHAVDAESLRASGKGPKGTTIGSVELSSVPVRTELSGKVEELKKKLADIDQDIASTERGLAVITRQRQMLADLSLDGPSSEPVPGSPNVARSRTMKEMIEVLELISEGQRRFEPALRSLEQQSKKLAQDKQFVSAQLNKLQQVLTEQVIDIAVSATTAGELTLSTTYQVRGASWRPSYRLLLSEQQDEISSASLETNSLISQRTGEDWKNVAITLSTARPNASLVRPEPQGVILDVFAPVTVFNEGKMRRNSAKLSAFNAAAPAAQALRGAAMDSLMKEESLAEPAEAESALINTSGAVVTYSIARPVTLNSDGSQEKVRVGSETVKTSILNIAVPKLNPEVFREATITLTDAPLLAGELSVFVDGEFVGKRAIANQLGGALLKIPVGVSQTLRANRKLAKRFEDDSGVVRSVRRISSEYSFEVENTSKRAQKLVVIEPAPISRNDKIKVVVSDQKPTPVAVADKTRVSQAGEGVLEWVMPLAASSKQNITYNTVVEFPADLQVSGLEDL